ncbi:hypothetical protein CCP3SC15_770003 [Gammaproteobacteria bacterium]
MLASGKPQIYLSTTKECNYENETPLAVIVNLDRYTYLGRRCGDRTIHPSTVHADNTDRVPTAWLFQWMYNDELSASEWAYCVLPRIKLYALLNQWAHAITLWHDGFNRQLAAGFYWLCPGCGCLGQ